MSNTATVLIVSLCLRTLVLADNNTLVDLQPHSMSLEIGGEEELLVVFKRPVTHNTTFVFTYRDLDGKRLNPKSDNESVVTLLQPFNVTSGSADHVNRSVVALQPGHVYIGLNQSTGNNTFTELDNVVCNVAVMRQKWLRILEVVVGWMYFAAWTVSFYPQVFLNWRRKSVVGFNFDFLFLNLTGFFVYSVYNLSLYAIPAIQDLYHKLYPVGEIPVRMNDIFFSVHAFVICIITGIQVAIYELMKIQLYDKLFSRLPFTAIHTRPTRLCMPCVTLNGEMCISGVGRCSLTSVTYDDSDAWALHQAG